MRIATVQMHDGPKLVVDVEGDYRRLDFDVDLLSVVQAGVDPRNLAFGDAVAGELVAPLQPGRSSRSDSTTSTTSARTGRRAAQRRRRCLAGSR